MFIKDIPACERPRERLLEYGSSNISNTELLSIILKQGTRKNSVKEISTSILNMTDNVSSLKNLTLEQLMKVDGIGQAQALTLIACIELGRRIFMKYDGEKIILNNSLNIFEYMKYLLFDKKQEYFYCIYVNNKKEVIEKKLLFIGTINRSIVHPREVFKNAFLCSASGIICIHNHPSGDITPSIEDINLTRSLVDIGHLTAIPIIDHIIICNDKYYSFFDDGKYVNF